MNKSPNVFHLFGMGAFAILACLSVVLILWRGVTGDSPYGQAAHFLAHDLLAHDAPSSKLDAETEARIVAFCSDCHALPPPDSFPRDVWYEEVRLGYEYYARSGRQDLDPPLLHETVEYFRSLAPEQILFPAPPEVSTEHRDRFVRDKLDWQDDTYVLPAIASLQWTPVLSRDNFLLLACDIRDGSVSAIDLRAPNPQRSVLARLNNPARVEVCDLDGNGVLDLIVADLGSLLPYDHERGRVVWLRRRPGTDSFEEIVIASGLGRVADVRAADFDADGRKELVVAEFGHDKAGSILLLKNVAGDDEPPRFEPRTLDIRPGTIHVPVHDFNQDGQPDFVALISQEYESVDLFLNQGGRFQRQTIWTAEDLSFGSSGIELVDLNQNGKMDILYTNGDAFDNSYANRTHGVQWLENLGDQQFAYHRLADMPGAYRALAGDFNQSGKLDIIVTACLPSSVQPASLRESSASIMLLEQTSPGVFVPHVLERGTPRYITLELGDFNDNGALDFIVGSMVLDPAATSPPPRLTIWWNQQTP